jgi:hypothetical protein
MKNADDTINIYKHNDGGSGNLKYQIVGDIYEERFDLTSKKTDMQVASEYADLNFMSITAANPHFKPKLQE